MGYIAIAYSFGVLTAPLLGGVVYARAGYYAVYGMIYAVMGFDVLFRVVLIERREAAAWTQSADLPLAAVSPSHDQSIQSTTDSHELAGSPVKLLPILRLLKSRRMLVAWWGTFVAGVLYASFDTTLPLFCKRTFGWNSTGSGLVFLCLSLPSFSGPVVGG